MMLKLFVELFRAIMSGKRVKIDTYEHHYLCPNCTGGGQHFEMSSNDWSFLAKMIKIHEATHKPKIQVNIEERR